MDREKLITWLNGQTWSENYQLADWHIAEITKAKQEGYKEIALLCAKRLKYWSGPGAASCAFDEARYAVKEELRKIKAFCNKKIINEVKNND